MNGGNWICSGSVVNDALSTASIVLSAGHCAFDQANHVFVTNWIFIPEFDFASVAVGLHDDRVRLLGG